MSLFFPVLTDEQQHRTRMNIERPMQNTLGAVAGNPDTALLAAPAITTVKRWVSVMMVSSNIRITVRARPAKPRLSPLWPDAKWGNNESGRSGVSSTPVQAAPVRS